MSAPKKPEVEVKATAATTATTAAAAAGAGAGAGAGAAAGATRAAGEGKEEKKEGLDEALYSRQLYVFGHEAQKRMSESNVLIVGLKGLGVEIAKNVILAGVKSVGLLDNGRVEIADLGSQFYLSEANIGQPRAAASLTQLATLNRYVKTSVVTEELSVATIESKAWQVVVLIDRPIKEQLAINAACHTHGVKFISADIRGLFASAFVDLGDAHVVSDLDGENPFRGLIMDITKGKPGIVLVNEDSRHGLQTGDLVTFEDVKGMNELMTTPPRPIKVISPWAFSIEDTSAYGAYELHCQGYFLQVKPPTTLSFARLADCIRNPKLVSDGGTSLQLHCLYNALSAFQEANGGRLPEPTSGTDAKQVVDLAKSFAASGLEAKVTFDDTLLYRLARCSSAQINPMAAFLGGVVGQEVLKAVSGKFTPLQQNLYFDASSSLPATELTDTKEFKAQGSRYDHQIAIFGSTLHRQLTEQKYFLVGAGAIGCEMLKNWALMGVATARGGRIHVTDMDNIETSNLNRQFLFRTTDVGGLKSATAAREILKMNPAVQVDAGSIRVAPSTEEVYDDTFWESMNGVCTALDNVEARLYVDTRCVYYQRPLIDSGTLGSKGNTQVVVPFLSESYGSSRDPPEESIPICTLKNYPFKIEHTIQWARDAFEGHFKQSPDEVNSYLTSTGYLAENAKQPNTQLSNLRTIIAYLVRERPRTFDDCINWARLNFEDEFNNKIQQLLYAFPADSVTKEGMPFWSGTKRAPTPLRFDPEDALHLDFITAAATLRAFNFGITPNPDPEYIKAASLRTVVPTFSPRRDAKIAVTDAEAKAQSETVEDDYEGKVRELTVALPAVASVGTWRMAPAEFEKDDDKNSHIAFINACSNLRARNYRIKEVSRHQTKQTAGKIIPAIATTTALVTGLVCLEIYKLLQKKPLEAYRNTYVNLAINLIAQSEPLPTPTAKAQLKAGEWKFSMWDKLDVDIGDETLQTFLDHFQEKYGLEVQMLNYGSSMLYNSFGLGDKKKIKARLEMPMSRVAAEVSKVALGTKEKFLILEAVVATEDGNEIEIPQIRFRFRK